MFPHVTPHWCTWLRDRLLHRVKVRLYGEFVAYLRAQHAALYSLFLTHGKKWIVEQERSPNHQGGWAFSSSQLREFWSDLEAGTNVLSSYQHSRFFEWSRGSTLIYWRWYPTLRRIARDGFPPCFDPPLPSHHKPTRKAKADVYEIFFEKVVKFI